jgi:bile acid:Na+ symporter, BASS family
VIAQTVPGSVELNLPAAVYGVLMFFIAFGFGFLIRERRGADAGAEVAPADSSPTEVS